MTGCVTSEEAAVAVGANGVQAEVPRSSSASECPLGWGGTPED